MTGVLAAIAYSLAIGLPVWFLHHYGAQAWYWHALALVLALGIGFVPTPAGWQSAQLDLAVGFFFILLLAFGIGGLTMTWGHREKHA